MSTSRYEYHRMFSLAARVQMRDMAGSTIDDAVIDSFIDNVFRPATEDDAAELDSNLLSLAPLPEIILMSIAAVRLSILDDLSRDFNGTLRKIYWMLRAVQKYPQKKKLPDPTVDPLGPYHRRPNQAEKLVIQSRDNGCVVTGHDDPTLPQYAHIIPYRIIKYQRPLDRYFDGIKLAFGEEVYEKMLELCVGTKCNDPANMVSLCPNIHSMIDGQYLYLVPVFPNLPDERLTPMDVLKLQRDSTMGVGPPFKPSYIVEYKDNFRPQMNQYTTNRSITTDPNRQWKTLHHEAILTEIDAGDPLLHSVSTFVGRLAAFVGPSAELDKGEWGFD